MKTASPSPTSRPPRRARGSLTELEILDAAERVAQHGFDAMTMRSVAAEIGASPMSLYSYFVTKDDLTQAMLDRVLQRVQLPEPTDDWLADLAGLAHNHCATLLKHPWAIGPLFSHPDPGPGAQRIGGCAFEILARGGVVGEDALSAFSAVLTMNYGWVSFAAAGSPSLGAYAEPANYDRALALLLDGIAAHASRK